MIVFTIIYNNNRFELLEPWHYIGLRLAKQNWLRLPHERIGFENQRNTKQADDRS